MAGSLGDSRHVNEPIARLYLSVLNMHFCLGQESRFKAFAEAKKSKLCVWAILPHEADSLSDPVAPKPAPTLLPRENPATSPALQLVGFGDLRRCEPLAAAKRPQVDPCGQDQIAIGLELRHFQHAGASAAAVRAFEGSLLPWCVCPIAAVAVSSWRSTELSACKCPGTRSGERELEEVRSKVAHAGSGAMAAELRIRKRLTEEPQRVSTMKFLVP